MNLYDRDVFHMTFCVFFKNIYADDISCGNYLGHKELTDIQLMNNARHQAKRDYSIFTN